MPGASRLPLVRAAGHRRVLTRHRPLPALRGRSRDEGDGVSGTTGVRRRRERFLAVIGEALDALHAHDQREPVDAAGHLRETAQLAERLAARLDAEIGGERR